MSENLESDQTVRDELLARRKANNEAAVLETAGMVKTTWIIQILGWLVPIVPILGWLLCGAGLLTSFILAIVILVKGNIKSGVILLVSNIVASPLIIFIWMLITISSIANYSQ